MIRIVKIQDRMVLPIYKDFLENFHREYQKFFNSGNW